MSHLDIRKPTHSLLILALTLMTLALSCADRSVPLAVQTPSAGPMVTEKAAMAEEAPSLVIPNPQGHDGGMGGEVTTPLERMVIREANLDLRADAPAEVIAQATTLVESIGGFVVTSSANGADQTIRRVDLTARVPADRFEQTLAKLRGMGVVLNEQITGQDVTEEYLDVEARLRARKALEARFIGLLSESSTVEDTLRIEQELSRVREDIERAEGRRRFLADRVAMSTIHLSATSPYQGNDPRDESFVSVIGRAFDDSASIFVNVCGGIIRVGAALIPIGGLLGLLGSAFYFLVRFFLRRRRRA